MTARTACTTRARPRGRTSGGGGGTLCVTRAKRNAVAYDSQVLYVAFPLGKAGTTYDIAQPMVCVSDVPAAWAPAEGETLSGGVLS